MQQCLIRLLSFRANVVRSHSIMQQQLTNRGAARAWAPAPSSRRRLHVAASSASAIQQTIADNKVVVYSATYCPYCSQAKGLFSQLSVPAKVIECDVVEGGPEIREALAEVTGRRTVPQVFVGGKHLGGCDDTMAAYQSGALKKMLAGVGISI